MTCFLRFWQRDARGLIEYKGGHVLKSLVENLKAGNGKAIQHQRWLAPALSREVNGTGVVFLLYFCILSRFLKCSMATIAPRSQMTNNQVPPPMSITAVK
jgi:hypothetical protein